MISISFAAILSVLTAADPPECYGFHLSVTTLEEAIQVIHARKSVAPAPRAEADARMKQLVMLFERGSFTRWRATMASCAADLAECEALIHSGGSTSIRQNSDRGASPMTQYDLGFVQSSAGKVRIRCLKPHCLIRFSNDDGPWSKISLQFDETHTVSLPVDVEVRFPAAARGEPRP